MMRTWQAVAAVVLVLAGCVAAPVPQPGVPQPGGPDVIITPAPDTPANASASARTFVSVVSRMEPAVERECLQRRTQPINCDFQFVVDDRAGLEPNAFQTVDPSGRPIIGFTLSLIGEARNADELAFVIGHEASHHILGHISRKTGAATVGAVILGGLASAYGGDPEAIRTAQDFGAQFGARYYSKDWELEADYLGAIITLNAGFDPEHGALFFARIPDPGDKILGTHPSRNARMGQVARAVADYRAGRVR
ncbi:MULTISPECIES: M48 family metalloprotease [Paracoccus]|uniref:M48 family metalloprotease n=1 Tax=Paracoccus TaxID=265 RepID=UPI001BDB7E08|nr:MULTISPECIES: M48 family metalloprotease [Paracoccus]MBT0779640.1 M48 family metalloprotease [Paracoccus sp. pheM1]MCJ1899102.1 M48 family metalloprotease [Paracoccus versutus]MDF3903511.1 M48 family metalloprotease [Paracoccus sp. AS002]WGR61263.1 peptidase M48 [Paracoccus ferrooxidans]